MRQQDGVHIDISGKSEADLCNNAHTFFGCVQWNWDALHWRAAMVMYGRCSLSRMDAGDGSVGLWLMVSLVPPRSSKVSASANKSCGGGGKVASTRGVNAWKYWMFSWTVQGLAFRWRSIIQIFQIYTYRSHILFPIILKLANQDKLISWYLRHISFKVSSKEDIKKKKENYTLSFFNKVKQLNQHKKRSFITICNIY